MYRLTHDPRMVARDDGWNIVEDASGADWQAYQAWLAAGNLPEPYVAPAAPAPDQISDVEFAIGLWKRDLISFEEAEAFTGSGALPGVIQGLIAQMPLADRQMLTLKLKGLTAYPRLHPFTEALRIGFGWTPAQRDDFFRFCKGQ